MIQSVILLTLIAVTLILPIMNEETIQDYLDRTGISQKKLAQRLGFKSQGSVAGLLKREVYIYENDDGSIGAFEKTQIPARRHA